MDARIEMLAKQAELGDSHGHLVRYYSKEVQRFAELVRNEVLEEAAEACEHLSLKSAKACAEVIRLEKS